MLSNNLPELIVAGAIAFAVIYYLVQRKKLPVRKVQHAYFTRLWLWPPGSHTRWEAEVDMSMPGAEKKIGLHSETTHDAVAVEHPTEAEVAFCKKWLDDLDGLFALTKPGIEQAWKDWVKSEMPERWQSALTLDSFSVPKDGDMKHPWGVTWSCEPAGHWFYIEIRDGKASLASVDG